MRTARSPLPTTTPRAHAVHHARGPLAVALLLATLAACAGTDLEDESPALPTAEDGAGAAQVDPRSDEVMAALREGDLALAHELLEGVLLDRYLTEARTLIEAAPPNPQDGLLWLDKALAIHSTDGETVLLHGEGNFVLAEQMVAHGSNGVYITGAFEDSLSSYKSAVRQLPYDPRPLLGASRAAYNLSRFDEAMAYVERALEAIERDPDAHDFTPSPARTYAEIAYGTYVDATIGEASEQRQSELFGRTELALEALLGSDASDAWVWTTLANLYLWEERTEDAKSALKRGLDRAPEDAGLLAQLVDVSTANGGREMAIQDLNVFVNKHPEIAGGFWWLAVSQFDLACDSLTGETPAPDRFEAAERAFARARELEPEREAPCKGYEVVCRSGLGWFYHDAGELELASKAFLSMNDVFPRGIEWRYEGRLRSGITGLHSIGFKYAERSEWEGAASSYETLRELQPDNSDWANNAGFFHRDRAVELEQLGRDLCRRSQNLPQDPATIGRLLEREGLDAASDTDPSALLSQKAEEHLARARASIEKSYAAYRDAAELAPEDVRIVNDTALVLIYYMNRDLDHAEELLVRSIEMGTEQMKDTTLEDNARYALENALGDAYENMGFLHLVRLREPDEARPFLLKALEMGDPRPKVTGQLLPLCNEDPDHPSLVEWRSWGRPCASGATTEDPVR